MRYTRILQVIGIEREGVGVDRKVLTAGYPWHYNQNKGILEETRISQLYHYVCEVLELLFMFFLDFTSKIQQPMRKCAIRVYV